MLKKIQFFSQSIYNASMMIQKVLATSGIIIFSGLFALQVSAANLYRYTNDEGVKALSTSLPPEAAKRGYDILDANSMRLIKTVPPELTAEEIAAIEQQKADEAEQQRLADIAAKEQAEIDRKQAIQDQTLLATYSSLEEFIDAKQRNLKHKQDTRSKLIDELPSYEADLVKFQQQAADDELAGRVVSENLLKRINAAKEEISNHRLMIEQLNTELQTLEVEYERDELRLQQLLTQNQ
jgi:hypothetical protein